MTLYMQFAVRDDETGNIFAKCQPVNAAKAVAIQFVSEMGSSATILLRGKPFMTITPENVNNDGSNCGSDGSVVSVECCGRTVPTETETSLEQLRTVYDEWDRGDAGDVDAMIAVGNILDGNAKLNKTL